MGTKFLGEISTDKDLVDKEYVDTGLAAKQGTLTAGTGINITNNVISATGGGGTETYTMGWDEPNLALTLTDGTTTQTLPLTGVGTPITVDTAMSGTSENAVQNKVIKGYVDNLFANAGVNFEVGVERHYGTYTDENGVLYQSYSKIIYIPALPSTAGITNYPHGISGIKQILQVYGFTTDGFVLNAPRQNAQDNIAVYQAQKAGNIAIEVGKDRSSKKAYVTLIYAKNN